MGVTTHRGTQPGGVTPTCDACGIALCWDISRTEYLEAKAFWDAWKCQECHGSRMSAFGWKTVNGREALAPEIEAVVVAFADANPELEIPECHVDAHATCAAFVSALADAGIDGVVAEVANARGRPDHAVTVGDFTVDWTANRRDEDAPVPLVHRTSIGRPVLTRTRDEMLARIADLDPEAFEALIAKALARKKALEA